MSLLKEAPFVALVALAAWDDDTVRREEAARVLGAGACARLRVVVLPRLAPAVAVASLLVSAFAIGAFEIALLVGPTTPQTIATYALDGPRSPTAAGPRALQPPCSSRRRSRSPPPPSRRAGSAARACLRRVALLVLAAVVGAGVLGLVVRAAADVWRAPRLVPQDVGLRGISAVSSDPALREATATSIGVAIAAALLALPLAWPAARAVASRRGGASLLVVLALPLLVPGYAVGTGLAVLLLRIGVPDGLPSLLIAHLPIVLAYEIAVLAPAFGDRLARLEEAGAVLGAGAVARFRLVALPTLATAAASAALVGATASLAQYGTTLVVGAGATTLPLLLVPFVQADPQIAATLALLLAAPAVLGIVLSSGRGARPAHAPTTGARI